MERDRWEKVSSSSCRPSRGRVHYYDCCNLLMQALMNLLRLNVRDNNVNDVLTRMLELA